jgi:hypothetical protein
MKEQKIETIYPNQKNEPCEISVTYYNEFGKSYG